MLRNCKTDLHGIARGLSANIVGLRKNTWIMQTWCCEN